LTLNNSLNHKNSPGYNLIIGKILEELPTIGIQYLTQLFNAVLLKEYFPAQGKVSQIILIPKPGKPPHEITSYLAISLLPIISKVLKKFLLKRLLPIVGKKKSIPNHQFGFRQTHRIVQRINEAQERKQYYSAAFLDITQVFDKVRHTELLCKLKLFLPLNYFLILKSYLQNRQFLFKTENEYNRTLHR
jgi:hypothetical protein